MLCWSMSLDTRLVDVPTPRGNSQGLRLVFGSLCPSGRTRTETFLQAADKGVLFPNDAKATALELLLKLLKAQTRKQGWCWHVAVSKFAVTILWPTGCYTVGAHGRSRLQPSVVTHLNGP